MHRDPFAYECDRLLGGWKESVFVIKYCKYSSVDTIFRGI